MRLAVFIAVLQICDCKHHSKSRNVNLALETVLEFDKNHTSADIEIIDKVQGFLNRVKHLIGKNKNYRKCYTEGDLTFTEFIKNVIIILNGYNDKDLEGLIAVAEDEVRKYHYRGCKFYELIDNHDIRRFMASKLDQIKTTSTKKLRYIMNIMLDKLQEENLGLKHKMISMYLNSLYKPDDALKFSKVLDNLSLYKRKSHRSSLDLVKIVRNGIRSVIFDHYSNLDVDTRKDLKIKLEAFWRDYAGSNKLERHVWQLDTFTRVKPKRPVKKQKTYSDDENFRSFETAEVFTPNMLIRNKKRKIKDIVEENSIERDLIKMKRSTNKQKLTFITLYPEAITFKKRHHKYKVRKGGYGSTDYKDSAETQTRHWSKHGKKSTKQLISDNRGSLLNEKPRFTALGVDSEYEKYVTKPKRMRYNVVRRHPKVRQITILSNVRQKVNRGSRKFNVEPRVESVEGMSIEFISRKPFRKFNDNDTLFVTNDQVTTGSNKTTRAVNFKGKNVKPEKELKILKAQIDDKSNYIEATETQYEVLDFWEDTTKYLHDDNETIATNAPILTTLDQVSVITSSVTTTETVLDAVTMTPLNVSKAVFRSRDISLDVKANTIEPKETKKENKMTKAIPKPTRKIVTTTKKVVIKKNLEKKPEMANIVSMSLVPFSKEKSLINETASRKHSENEIPDDINDKEIINNIDLEMYLNDTKPTDDKSERVRQKMLEDIQMIMPDLDKSDNEKPSSDITVIPTIGVDDKTDPLDIINDSI